MILVVIVEETVSNFNFNFKRYQYVISVVRVEEFVRNFNGYNIMVIV